MKKFSVLMVACAIATSTVAFAQGRRPAEAPQAPAAQTTPAAGAPARESAASAAPMPWTTEEIKTSSTRHTLRLDGREITYTATAGTIPIRDPRGKVAAYIFFVAYAKDGEDLGTRPISFLYNGGPGSASVWLHLGSFGPKRVLMADDGFQPAPPFKLVDNENSLLDTSDLVFIDAVGTGYSRGVTPDDAKQFYGVGGDLRAFGEFIRLYLNKFNRWKSPKFLIGESYGTVRSAGLSQELQQRHGIELNGIVLISSVIDFSTLGWSGDNDMVYPSFLPTFTATAWYHKKLPADLQGDLKKAVAESRAFAWGEYWSALAKGSTLTDAERKSIAQKLARLTGISAAFVEQSNLRIGDNRFRKELLRDERLMVGRLDGRHTGLDADAAGERQEFDPSNTAMQGAWTALFEDYSRNELKWDSDLKYDTSGQVNPWDYSEFSNRFVNLTGRLRGAMARNPFLKVFVANGYYDMATPLGGTEYTFAHLGWEPTYRQRVSMGYYEGGHMMYTRPTEHKVLKADLAKFIREASNTVAKATNSQ